MRILKPAFCVCALLGLVASTALAQDGVTRYVRFTSGACVNQVERGYGGSRVTTK